MIIKIEDTFINLDNVKWMRPCKIKLSKFALHIEFNPSGYVEIGVFSNLKEMDMIIRKAEVINFYSADGKLYL